MAYFPNERLDVDFAKSAGALHFTEYGGWQSRHPATIHMLLEAIRTIKPDLKDFSMRIFTGDKTPDDASFAYAKRADQQNVTTIPDYFFWYWPEIGVPDYPALVQQMIRSSVLPPVSDKLFWIGNPTTHPSRERLIRATQGRADMQIEGMGWRNITPPSRETIQEVTGNYVSLPDHCRFKYLLNLRGVGHSGRLKALLFSGRPVLVQDSPLKEFFRDRLVPFEHFIPVQELLRDLDEKLEWARSHERECTNIAAAAQAFALENLTREAAILYLRSVLVERFHG